MFLVLAGSTSRGAEPADVIIQQVYVNLPSVTVYMDVLGPDGTPLTGLQSHDCKAILADQWLSFDSVEPFEKTSEGVAYIAVLDVSRSIRPQQFAGMIAALHMWVAGLSVKDRMALIAVGSSARLIQDFTANKTDLFNGLGELKPNEPRTALYAALIEGMRLTQGRTDLPMRRAIVVLTDGRNDDDTSGLSADDVHQAIEQYRVPIFAIGITREPPPRNADRALAILAGFASSSRGLYVPLGKTSIGEMYDQILHAIRRVYVGRLSCARCPRDGRKYAFKVIARGRESVPVQLTLFPPVPSPPPARRSFRWLILGLAILLAVIIVLLVAWRRNWFKTPVPPPQLPPRHLPPGMPLTLVSIGGRSQYKAAFIDRRMVGNDVVITNRIITAGSDPSCDICVTGDDTIAPQHCEFYLQGGNVYVRNLASSTGTALNGVLIKLPQEVASDDRIRIGRTDFRVLFGDGQ